MDTDNSSTAESKRIWDDPPEEAWTEEEIAEIQYAARHPEQ
mgnify:CR=1 FL=1